MGGPADAIDAAFLTENHADPGNIDPDFTAVDFNLAGMDNGTVTSIVFNAGNAIETTWNGFQPGVDAVSAVYMHDSIMNEYAIETNVGGESDWVVTFPTKKYYVNTNSSNCAFHSYLHQW